MDAQTHHCPQCGGSHAERRTVRNMRERAAHTLMGYHPYRCLDCGRRFLDRPVGSTVAEQGDQRRPRHARPAAVSEPAAIEPATARVIAKHAPTRAVTTDGMGQPRRRRRPRWVIDPGNTPLGRTEIYAIVLAGGLLVLALMALLQFTWPVSTGGVKLLD